MDKGLEPMKAVEKSWQMTKGHGWKVFWMAILSFFIAIAGLICFIFGILISLMWIHAAFASLYQSVLNENDDNNPIPILGVNEE
jgi:membrane-anchored glycerophosphoryl diester phosphodiesterase (GDPDase)